MKTLIFIAGILLSQLDITAQIKDIDGNTYETVEFGSQIWLKDNLNTHRFSNGDSIFYAKNMTEWKQAMRNRTPAFCDYDFDPANSEKFGKLYNHYAVTDPRGLAPYGCIVPSKKDFNRMITCVGDGKSKGDRIGDRLKSKSGWTKNYMTNGSNTSGLSLKPNGRVNSLPYFWNSNQAVHLWTSTTFGPFQGYVFCLFHSCTGPHVVMEHFQKRTEGFPVRCIIKDQISSFVGSN